MTASNDSDPRDEDLSAWLDGGMDKDGADRMANLAASDESVAHRASRLRRIDDLVRTAVPLDEDVPEDLLVRLGLSPATPAASNVIDLAAARSSRAASGAGDRTSRCFAALDGGWRIAAQVVLVLGVGLTGSLWYGSTRDRPGEPKAEYTALGDAPSPGSEAVVQANALVMFGPGVGKDSARAIMTEAGARVISGPSGNGVWQVAIKPSSRDAVLAKLRDRDDVTMAESLGGGQP